MAKKKISKLIKPDSPFRFIIPMFAVVIFVVFAIAVVLSYRQNLMEKFANKQPEAAQSLYKDCQMLSGSCNSESCQYYGLCNFATGYKNCSVYDCGKSYGVEINTRDKSILTKSYDKPDISDTKERIESCQGTVKIVDSKCDTNSKRKVVATIVTASDCSVEAIAYQQSGSWKRANVSSPANGTYTLSLPSCDPVTELNAIGVNGLLIASVKLE